MTTMIKDFGKKIGGAAKDRAAARCGETSGETATATITRRRQPRPPQFGCYWFSPEVGYVLLRKGDKARRVLKTFANMADARGWWLEATAATDRGLATFCLLYTSPSPRDRTRSRMPSSA